jgi:vacuolar-type H+-ATPase subunit D/Vma8
MPDFEEMVKDLRQKRDELRVQINLGSKEAKEEWEELEEKMEEFSTRVRQFSSDAGLKETGEGLGEALGKLGHELKLGYERLRKAIKD